MSVLKGDYIGFTYNGVHSSDLGIVRTSDGSRFNENLLPTMQDKTVQVPGGDGTYYFGSYYTQRQFSVSFAFDTLTENELAGLKRHFGDKGIHDLIFDETPYKVWSAKVTGTATIKYIPFDEGDTHRLYKGEGSIQFTCYYPFARCYSTDPINYGMVRADVTADNYKENTYYYHDTVQKKFILDSSQKFISSRKYYTSQNVQKVNEWWAAARIAPNVNFGDVAVPFKITISSSDENKVIVVNEKEINWTELPNEVSAILDTRTGIAKVTESTNNECPIGSIVNKYVTGDLTAKIPVGGNLNGAEFTCLYI